MKFINFVSKIKIDKDDLCLTVNVNEIKAITPALDVFNPKTNIHKAGYFIELNSSNQHVFINASDYKIIQDFLSNENKYLEIKVEWI